MLFEKLIINVKETLIKIYKTHKVKVLIGSSLFVILIAALVILLQIGNNNEDINVMYMEVTTGDISESIDVVGTLEAVPSIILSWESNGIISPFEIQIGDQVEKDQVLLSLEDASLPSTILQAQTSLLEAEAALENMLVSNTELHTAAQTLADLEYALIDYTADRNYWNFNGASWKSIEKAREDYYAYLQISWEKQAAYDAVSHLEPDDPVKLAVYEEQKSAILEADKYLHYLSNLLGVFYDHAVETDFIEYDKALGDVEQARNTYNRALDQSEEIAAAEANVQALQNAVDQANIVAPFSGTITEIYAVGGELVSSGTQAMRIDNLDHMMVDVYVSEIDINEVAIGQSAILTFDALPNNEYDGYVESISSAGTDANGVVEFRVSVVLVDPNEEIKPGFTTVVSIITSEEEDALLVPTQAIQTQNGQPVVIKANADGSTTTVPVELGTVSDTNTQVISGDLAVGDQLMVMINSTSETAETDETIELRQIQRTIGN